MQIRHDDLRDRLADIAEELGDRALDRLRAAAGDGEEDARAAAVTEEKRLTRARRAVEKAVHLLDDGPAGDDLD
jgi:hypothetical protein